MAKLSVTVAVTFTVLLFLLAGSQARIPSNVPEHDDVNGRELPVSHSDTDVSPILRLPSDSVNAEPHSAEAAGDIPESESISVRYIPLRVFRFLPINRHFPIGPRSPFHNCHHHLHRRHDLPFFKPIRQQQEEEHVEIPYGNDMKLSTGGNNEFDQLMFHHGRMRRIPARWVNFRYHDDDDDHDHEDDGLSKFLLEHSLRFGKEKFKKHLHHHHEDDHEEEENEEMNKKHLHHHPEDREEEENEEMKERQERREEKEGGLVNRIRKFLDHF